MTILLGVYLLDDSGPVSVSGSFVDRVGNPARDANGNVAPPFSGTIPMAGNTPMTWSQVAGLSGRAIDLYPGAVAVSVVLSGAIRVWQAMGQDPALFQNNVTLGALVEPNLTDAATQADVESLQSAINAQYSNATVDSKIGAAVAPYLTSASFSQAISDYYTKEQSDARFLGINALAPYYTGAQSDAKYLTQTQGDARYLQASSLTSYQTTAQADAKYETIASFNTTIGGYSTTVQMNSAITSALTPYSTTTQMNAAITSALSNYYTKAQTDSDIASQIAAALANYYTKAQIDALFGSYYTRTQTDSLNPPFMLKMFGRAITLVLSGTTVIAADLVQGPCKLVQGRLVITSLSVALTLTIRKNGTSIGTIAIPALTTTPGTYNVDFTGLADATRTCAADDVIDILAPALVSVIGSFTFRVTTAKIAGHDGKDRGADDGAGQFEHRAILILGVVQDYARSLQYRIVLKQTKHILGGKSNAFTSGERSHKTGVSTFFAFNFSLLRNHASIELSTKYI